MMLKLSSLFLLAGILYASPSMSNERPRISVSEAKALVMAALTPSQRRLPSAQAEYSGDEKTFLTERFIGITAIWSGESQGSVVIGVYDVDPYTGDVFSASSECLEYHNARLKKLQEKIRERLSLSKSKYYRIKTRGNLCN